MYDHIKSLKRVGGTDIPVGDSIESEDARKARAAALASDKAVATVKVTDTEAVKEAIKVHVMGGAGGARIAGFGPTSTSSTSGVHSHPDAFHRRKGVVNTMGGAKDVSRADAAPKLPPKGPGGAMPGARVAGLSSLDPHAVEGKAKRAAAEAKMRSHSSGPGDLGGGSGGGSGSGGANIAGFSKNMGVARIAGPAKRTGGGGGATVSAALAAAGKGPAPEAHVATHRPLGSLGGHGRVGGPAGSAAAGLPPRTGSAATTRSDPGSGSGSGAAEDHDGAGGSGRGGAAGGAGGGAGVAAGPDAARRAAFFRKQMADKAAATAAAVEMLKGADA